MMRQIDKGIWITDSLLNHDECVSLIQQTEITGFRVAHMINAGRHNKEVFLESRQILEMLQLRLENDLLLKNLSSSIIISLDRMLECYRYEEGEFIIPHRDSSIEIKPNIWSTHTLVVYLNDGFDGGETAFPSNEIKVLPQPGHGVLFHHSLLHEGTKVTKGKKYVTRLGVAMTSMY